MRHEVNKSPVKKFHRSCTNWLGFAMVLVGMVTEPAFKETFADLIPETWLSKIIFVSGWIVIALRTLRTNQPIVLRPKHGKSE